ncbi:hypothetical protein TNCV_2818161 [Trichonephila clavipes]|nr:hypothetical protein TNCV_2818161 [Trichonephila clavipes]
MDSAIFGTSDTATAYRVADTSEADAARASGEKSATRTHNILQLKINCTQKELDGQSDIIHQNNIHVACLQETTLNLYLNMKIKDYSTIHKDRENRPSGGIELLIKFKTYPYIKGTTRKVKTPVLAIYTHVHKLRIMKFRQRKRQKQNKFDLLNKRCGLSSLHSEHTGQFWNQEQFLLKRAILHHRNGVIQWCSLGGNGYLDLSPY